MPENKRNIVLLHGQFDPSFFDNLTVSRGDRIFVLEGRPNLDSSQVAIKGLLKQKLKPALIADNMAGSLFFQKLVKEVNLTFQELDDQKATCPVGSLILAVLAKKHKVPVYLHEGIVISKWLGQSKEVVEFQGTRVAPKGVKAYVPLIEDVPRKYISEIKLCQTNK